MSLVAPQQRLKTYGFTLVFRDAIDELTQEFTDAIFEAGCGDSHIKLCDGSLHISFDREAPTFHIALTSALAEIERTGFGLELSRLERD